MAILHGELELDEIQGNILGGFNKDFQDFVIAEVRDAALARAWIRDNSQHIASARQVLAFNTAYKALAVAGIEDPESLIGVPWFNIAFSARGLERLGFTADDHGAWSDEFQQGMAARAAKIGDSTTEAGQPSPSDPEHWLPPFAERDRNRVHVVLLLAADDEGELDRLAGELYRGRSFNAAFEVLGLLHGRTREDEPGHEHFGFKDGISQPGIRGVDLPDDPHGAPDEGHPGQDLLWPGEFVLGYPTQIRTPEPGFAGPNREPGEASAVGNARWTDNGSFLVLRRLEQDVAGFKRQLARVARENGLTPPLAGAKLVGRYESGCPLASLRDAAPSSPSRVDPGLAQPQLAASDALNNAFEFEADDPDGERVPLAAHIRKVYPRDQLNRAGARPGASESETQKHRLLRRGIPFGRSLAATRGRKDERRGLLFLAYQASIGAQFEYVQRKMANHASFPGGGAGQDPVIAQTRAGEFRLEKGSAALTLQHFVTTTGGEYLFAPSLRTLRSF